MKIQLTTDVLTSWIESYVTTMDLFFLSREHFEKINYKDVLIMPIDEFYSHSTYGQISYINSYEYWNIKHAHYVIIAQKDWITKLALEDQQLILQAQVQCERGLVVPASFVENLEDVPVAYIHNNQIVIQRVMWENLKTTTKQQLLEHTVFTWWDNGECEEIPDFLPDYLRPYANMFGTKQGANCLAAVIFAITNGRQPWFIEEWVHQKTFLQILQQKHYQLVDTEQLLPRDVIVWQDDDGVIQHAAFHIEQNLFFNKHGQTYFNPWKLLTRNQLEKEWGTLKQAVYRCVNE